MLLNKPEMVLLDLDGTLADTVPDLAYSIDTMLQEIDLPTAGEDKIRTWVGNGIEQLVQRALVENINDESGIALYDKAFPLFLEIYSENACERSTLYEGVQDGLEYLKEKNINLGCVTNKRGQFAGILLKKLGIYNDFGIVIAGDSLPKKKPDPMPLLHAADYFIVAPEKSLMIGDSINDINAARAAGFQILCVNYGYTQGTDIQDANPDLIVDSLAEIYKLF